MCKNPPVYNTITSFAGVRAFSNRHDFIIEESKNAKGVIHCVGIESPGLTAVLGVECTGRKGLVLSVSHDTRGKYVVNIGAVSVGNRNSQAVGIGDSVEEVIGGKLGCDCLGPCKSVV